MTIFGYKIITKKEYDDIQKFMLNVTNKILVHEAGINESLKKRNEKSDAFKRDEHEFLQIKQRFALIEGLHGVKAIPGFAGMSYIADNEPKLSHRGSDALDKKLRKLEKNKLNKKKK